MASASRVEKDDLVDFLEPNIFWVKALYQAVRRHFFLAAAVLIFGMAFTIVYTVLSPVLYRSTASVLIENSNKSVISSKDDQMVSISQDVTKAQKILAESRPVVMRACEIAGVPLESLKHSSTQTALPDYFEARPDGQLLYLEVMDKNQTQASDLANAWADAFVDEMTRRVKAPNIYAKEFLDKSLPDLRTHWIAKQEELNKFERETNFDPKEFDQHPLRKRVEELSNKVGALNMELAALMAEKTLVESPTAAPLSLLQLTRAKSDLVLQGYQKQIEERRAKLLDVIEKFKENSIEVNAARESLKQTYRDVEDAVSTLRSQITIEYERAKGERDRLEQLLKDAQAEFDQLKSKAAAHRVLSSETTMAEHLYSELAQKKSETELTGKYEYSYATHWEQAEERPVRYKPKWSWNLIVGFMVSFVAAVFCAFAAEKLDNTIRTGKDLEQRFGIAAAGVVPQFDGELALNGYTLVHHLPASSVADGLRNIHIALEVNHKPPHPGNPMIITITSAASGDGKSFIASNLASLFAGFKRKVLLIDADLRKGSLTAVFKCNNKLGMYDLIAGGAWSNDLALSGITPGYQFLPAGQRSDEHHDSIPPIAMERVLNLIKPYFDVIIFDTPPILALADASVISQFADVTLLVARSRKSNLAQTERAAASLYGSNVKELVFIVNGIDSMDAASESYGYGYGYGHGYGYGYGEKEKSKSRKAMADVARKSTEV